MSYDIVIFDSKKAPKDIDAFMEWCEEQEDLMNESLDVDEYETSSKKLHTWFLDICIEVIPLSGPFSNWDAPDFVEGQDDEHGADYFFAKHTVFLMFSTLETKPLFLKVKESAKNHNLGYFDFDTDELMYPK